MTSFTSLVDGKYLIDSCALADKHEERFVKIDPKMRSEAFALTRLFWLETQYLIKKCGLQGVSMNDKTSSSRTFFAQCKYWYQKPVKSVITLSPYFMLERMGSDPMNLLMHSFNTSAHELAHHQSVVLYGKEGHGHGWQWKSVMKELFGIDGKRCHIDEYNDHTKPPRQADGEILWQMYNLYNLWRLEDADWNHPVRTQIMNMV